MRTQQKFQVVGIGSFDLISIKQKPIEFLRVNNEGKEVEKKVKEKGTRTTYMWVDEVGKEYQDKDIFYDVVGKKIQKISRTEKVNNFEIVDKTEIYNLSETKTYILKCDETTRKNFDEKVKDSAIKIKGFKKSSVGMSFEIAYIYRSQKEILMITGLGNIGKAIKQFQKQKQADTTKTISIDVVEIKCDEVENEIAGLIN